MIYTINHETLVEIANLIKQSHPYNKNISFQEIVNEIDNLGKLKEEYLKFLGDEPKTNKIIIPKGITSVLIPATNFTIEEIEWQDLEESEITLQNGAFSKTKVAYLEIPKNVVALDGQVATSVSTLKEVVWKSSASIPANAFQYCSSLEKVQILGEIEEIGNSAFYSCKVKTFILNLERFKVWGNSVFGSSTTMEKILFVNGLKNLSTWAMLSVSINGSTRKIAIEEDFDLIMNKPEHTYIGNSPFFNCGNIQKAQLDYVENIGATAFQGSSLVELNAPILKTVQRAGFRAVKLKNINAPKLEELGEQAFYQSTFSCDLELPNLTKLGTSCFENATIEEGFIFNAPNIKELGSKCFYKANFPNLENNFENVEKIGSSCYDWVGDLSFPKLTTLSTSCFQYDDITGFSAPILETVPNHCFSNCTKLKTVYLPMVKTINSYAFTNCTFEEIDLPSLTALKKYAFQYCDELRVIHAQNLKVVESEACYYGSEKLIFLDSPNLEQISYRGLYNSRCKGNEYLGTDEEGNPKYRFNLPQITTIGEYAFSSAAETIILGSSEKPIPYNIFSTSSPFGNSPGVKELTIYYNGQDENLLNEEGEVDPKLLPYYPWGLSETSINFITV